MADEYPHYSGNSGYLVVDRKHWRTVERPSAMRDPSTGKLLDAETVANRYRGFDGDPWPWVGLRVPSLIGGLAPPGQIDETMAYYRAARQADCCDLLYLARDGAPPPRTKYGRLEWLGFDCGYFHSEWNFYSALFHECLFGQYDDLAGFSGGLNSSLLFDSSSVTRSFMDTRRSLINRGADLEPDEACEDICIFGWSDAAPTR